MELGGSVPAASEGDATGDGSALSSGRPGAGSAGLVLPQAPPSTPLRTSSGTVLGQALVTSAMPVTLQGAKGGYLYVKILQAGNLDALKANSLYCDPLHGGCAGVVPCAPRVPAQLRVLLSCTCLERAVVSSAPVPVDLDTQTAVFREEILVKTLSFCGVDSINLQLQAKGTVLGKASIPLRAALPPPLSTGAAAAEDSVANHVVKPKDWLPVQRFILTPPGKHGSPSMPAGVPSSSQPYLELQMLQLVDSALPQLLHTTPLMMAIEHKQEALVRAYLSLDVAETLPAAEQEKCITAAIESRSHDILVLLLDRIKPSHQHLLAAIRLHAVEMVELLVQVGGAPLLHVGANVGMRTRHRNRAGGRQVGHRGDLHRLDVPRGDGTFLARAAAAAAASSSPTPGPAQTAALPIEEAAAPSGPGWRPQRRPPSPPPSQPQPPRTAPRAPTLTPLALACSLGHLDVVEALCQWARHEKVHLDPSAPPLLGHDSTTMLPNRGAENSAGASSVALWWDHEDPQHEPQDNMKYGDPPMVMAVRGRHASLPVKLQLISTLARYGFSADVRSPVDSWTPLLAAVEQGSQELCQTLVKRSARLSAERYVGYTPLHLACQMGHWHLVPLLVEAMKEQYQRVAEWGPSPQYVSLNLADAYGRTALDIALLRYFANPLPYASMSAGKSTSSGNDRQKAVDILREFIHHSPPEDPGVVCGRELLRVLRFLDALPSKKVGAQFWTADCESQPESPHKPASLKVTMMEEKPQSQTAPYGDVEMLLQAVRLLVRAGAKTKWLLQDLVQPPVRGGASSNLESMEDDDFKESITSLGCKTTPGTRRSLGGNDDVLEEVSIDDL
eukprot:CAMPEP_0178380110 /NCGR_PEP_ID=MMETSP0689_2-20121128/5290_1 /TAXON_ID=160604 /ORGANISM="Amphidinium massartii, Strain CS-259" /LENGTH=842 /DNA_ID=CAMNT_0020000235 /DNA_START=93 /DNA_END=2621 /DNA_ORIENTATION=-